MHAPRSITHSLLILCVVGLVGTLGPGLSDVVAQSASSGEQSARPARKISEKFQGARREPPDRVADALHLRLEVSFDWERSEVDGRVTHTFRSFEDDLREITLDSVDIDVERVTDGRGRPLEHEVLPEKLVIRLGEPVDRGEEFELSIKYRCRPRFGIYFRKPTEDAPNVPKQIWSQGEAEEARHWIPCFDHPIERLTTELIVTAPPGLQVISNGKLIEKRSAKDDRGVIYHWKQLREHTTYLIAVVVGKFAEHRDEWDGIPIVSYVPPDRAADAARSFDLTADMMDYFSKKFGYRYPWAKYAQVCVHEFHFGGMENTGCTILTDRTLHDERGALDVSSLGLVAHELAHQWFGDLVTCRDWSHLWLNESFATFFENQYLGHRHGWDEEVYERSQMAESYLAEDRDRYRRPMVPRGYREPEDFFDSHSYPKGARILGMLMDVVGEEGFYAGIKRFLHENEFTSAETEQFRLAMEEATGKTLQWFFDQWIYSGGHPEYAVRWDWDSKSRMVKLNVKQTQSLDEVTTLFRMPVDIEITSPAGRTSHRVTVASKEENFSFPSPERPKMVRFDKRDWILKELDFSKSREELVYQLEHDDEVMGRIRAAKALGKLTTDRKARDALLRRLREDPFWGARAEIAAALGEFDGDDEVERRLVAAFGEEKSSKVRAPIVRALDGFKGSEVRALLERAIENDPSYVVIASALRGLAKLEGKGAASVLLRAFERESNNDIVRTSAFSALAELGEEGKLDEEQTKTAIEKLVAMTSPTRPVWTRASALRALSRIGKGNEKVFEVVSGALDDQFLWARIAAVGALGALGDERALPLLRDRRKKEGPRPFRNPIDMIDAAIRRIEKADDDGEDATEKELDRLRKRFEALEGRVEKLERR